MFKLIEKREKSDILILLFFAATTFGFYLFFAYNTTPLIKRYGEDSSMYLYMGRAVAHSKIIYADLFDHKGPLIFFVNALPQLFIYGSVGVWILEMLVMYVSVLILYKTARVLSCTRVVAMLTALGYIWLTTLLFNGGNYTEEYCNLFSVAALYIFVMWTKENCLPRAYAFVLGFCFAIQFFFRPNNTAFTVAVILYIGIYMLKNDRKNAGKSALYGVMGVCAVTLPILIYCALNGIVYDMLNATILHNLKYCGKGLENFHVLPQMSRTMMPGFCLILLANTVIVFCCISREEYMWLRFSLLCIVITAVSLLVGGRAFLYYWVIALPQTALWSMLIFCKKQKKKEKKTNGVLTATALIVSCAVFFVSSYSACMPFVKKKIIDSYKSDWTELFGQIPKEQQQSFFAYDIPAIGLYTLDCPAPLRYFTMQSWMALVDPTINDAIIGYIQSEKPLWIASYDRDNGGNRQLGEILSEDYELVQNNKAGFLYKRCVER